MKRLVLGGVFKSDDGYAFDYTKNTNADIIRCITPQLYRDAIHDNVYWFGYTFTDTATSKERANFIHYLKELNTDKRIPKSELTRFIENSLVALSDHINLYDISALVYPVSNRSPLVTNMISCIGALTSHDMSRISYELLKSMPQDITFDWQLFDAEYNTPDTQQSYRDAKNYINDVLLPKIHDLDYFSLAASVKSKYRPYIQNFLHFRSAEERQKFAGLTDADSVLVVDDINTSRSTLNEMLRLVRQANPDCAVYVYTLIGKGN